MIEIPPAPDQYKFDSVTVGNRPGDERTYEPTLAFVSSNDWRLAEVQIISVLINTASALPADTYDKTDPEHGAAISSVFGSCGDWRTPRRMSSLTRSEHAPAVD